MGTKKNAIVEDFERAAPGRRRAAPTEAPEPKAELDPDDPAQQQAILHPEGDLVELSFETIRLYPLSIAMQREAYAVVNGIMAAALGNMVGTSEVSVVYRTASIINRPSFTRDILRIIAFAREKPDRATEAYAGRLADELYERCTPDDMAQLFVEVKNRSGFTGPKA